MADISILAYNVRDGLYREFLVDFAILKAMFDYNKGEEIKSFKKFIQSEKYPPVVIDLKENFDMTIIKNTHSHLYGASVLVSADEYGDKGNRKSVFNMKRIIYTPQKGNTLIGMDTMSLPQKAVKSFIKEVKKMFKKADIELDLKNIEKGDESVE